MLSGTIPHVSPREKAKALGLSDVPTQCPLVALQVQANSARLWRQGSGPRALTTQSDCPRWQGVEDWRQACGRSILQAGPSVTHYTCRRARRNSGAADGRWSAISDRRRRRRCCDAPESHDLWHSTGAPSSSSLGGAVMHLLPVRKIPRVGPTQHAAQHRA
ncbi:hypothetical protein K431DRAFT_64578 [Polychaeton citri CBS 116435]|uniref:Uncharacterized protein n=1 Tax=Polychaeton citri CBS 116435 TaxID=1314669 RepID=A0A9P4Q736_9PEZI|nr:hypothetical protein K431DRAFT_64578 [Polychaeton citri CBS 116435]